MYPLIRSLPDVLFGDDPLTGSRIRHAVLAGLIVYLSGLLFERHIATPALVAVGAAAVLLSPILFNVTIYAWSEPLFILLTVLFLLILNA